MFRQYLLPFSSECCMYRYIKLTLFLSVCVGVQFGVLCQKKNHRLRVCEGRGVGRMFGVRGREGGRDRGVQKIV